MAIRARPGVTWQVKAIVSAVTHHAYHNGATMLSSLVSRLDGELIRTLKSCGLVLEQQRPFYILRSRPEIAVDEPAGLSFLDTDMSYR
jgi:hypothetical protein